MNEIVKLISMKGVIDTLYILAEKLNIFQEKIEINYSFFGGD